MKDIKVIVTVKNNVMLRAMAEEGFETASALARAAHVQPTQIGEYLNLKKAPFDTRGELRPDMERIAKALRRLPEDLFPKPFVHRALKSNRAEREVSSDEIPALLGASSAPSIAYEPERAMIVQEALAALDEALDELRPRERDMLRLYYGLADGRTRTIEEVAKIYGVTRERVRQIMLRGERIMRHPRHNLRARVAPLLEGAA